MQETLRTVAYSCYLAVPTKFLAQETWYDSRPSDLLPIDFKERHSAPRRICRTSKATYITPFIQDLLISVTAHRVATGPIPPAALSRPRTPREPGRTRSGLAHPVHERGSSTAYRKTWVLSDRGTYILSERESTST